MRGRQRLPDAPTAEDWLAGIALVILALALVAIGVGMGG